MLTIQLLGVQSDALPCTTVKQAIPSPDLAFSLTNSPGLRTSATTIPSGEQPPNHSAFHFVKIDGKRTSGQRQGGSRAARVQWIARTTRP